MDEGEIFDIPFLILVYGLPGSGKTRLSRTLSGEMNIQKLVELDQLVFQTAVLSLSEPNPSKVLYTPTNNILTKYEDWKLVHEDEGYVEGLINDGIKSIIVEDVFPLKSSRNRVRTLCNKKGYLYVEVLLDVDQSVCWERVEKRNEKDKNHVVVSKETFDRTRDIFERILKPKDYLIRLETPEVDVNALTTKITESLHQQNKRFAVEQKAKVVCDESVEFLNKVETESRRVLGEVLRAYRCVQAGRPELSRALNEKRRKEVALFKSSCSDDIDGFIQHLSKTLQTLATGD